MSFAKACRKVVCIGRNYVAHAKELGNDLPTEPFYFLKPPSSILLPDNGPLLVPKGAIVNHEVELVLIMGKKLTDLHPTDEKTAFQSIDSYALAIDATARNVQALAKKKGLPWTVSKGFDTFLPLSYPIDKSKIEDPYKIFLSLSVNGVSRQADFTNLMIFNIPKILSSISSVMTLEPGDIVLTGTPKGVGTMNPGDKVFASLSYKDQELATISIDVAQKPGIYQFNDTTI